MNMNVPEVAYPHAVFTATGGTPIELDFTYTICIAQCLAGSLITVGFFRSEAEQAKREEAAGLRLGATGRIEAYAGESREVTRIERATILATGKSGETESFVAGLYVFGIDTPELRVEALRIAASWSAERAKSSLFEKAVRDLSHSGLELIRIIENGINIKV